MTDATILRRARTLKWHTVGTPGRMSKTLRDLCSHEDVDDGSKEEQTTEVIHESSLRRKGPRR